MPCNEPKARYALVVTTEGPVLAKGMVPTPLVDAISPVCGLELHMVDIVNSAGNVPGG